MIRALRKSINVAFHALLVMFHSLETLSLKKVNHFSITSHVFIFINFLWKKNTECKENSKRAQINVA